MAKHIKSKMNIEICRLCKTNPADKKGSHIVPHFLLKRIENIEGKSGRDYELGFYIEEFDTKSHFGRALQQEKLEDIYGTLSEEEIEANKSNHPLIADNIFCSGCEKRLSIIESEYSKTLIEKGDGDKYKSGVSSEVGILFWMSVIWRMSINNKSGVQITKGEAEIARRILDRTLADSITNIDFENMQVSKDLKKIGYKILRCPGFSESSPTFLFFHPEFDKPYSLLIDEYILAFSFTNNYIHYNTRNFFGIREEILTSTTNQIGTEEEVGLLSEKLLKETGEGLIDKMKTIRAKNLDLFFNKIHVAIGGEGNYMPEKIKKEILSELTSNEKKLGRKYNLQDLRDSTIKILSKYGPIEE
ncbi:hypothetical protein [Maribellus maritimus]|uniref:hypothetical protein n=1 Tax=Maribellus maritimus TaxID=2870838 RepID=UPI001EEA1734|nr:hypothetical protein [Maribellus maritimus]MCG6191346.1 hypothetical protein [Maribellus maritimus]